MLCLGGIVVELDEFLKVKKFSKYNKTIDQIYDKFIDKGCEKFLWPNYRFQSKSEQNTEALIREAGDLIPNNDVFKFMGQFEWIDWDNEVAFIYPEDYTNNFFIIEEIAKGAKEKIIIENIFSLDDTINHLVVFDKKDIEDIVIMFYLTYSSSMVGDNFGGYKLFGKGLMFYADNLEYKGTVLKRFGRLAHFQGNQTRRDTNPFIILESRESVELVMKHGYFKDELELFRNLYEFVLPEFHSWYENSTNVIQEHAYDWKNRKQEIFSKLVAEGVIQSKWKSEETLFRMIVKKHPSALYQYRATWLSPQSLDIFIPELNIGIEYQGIQHYESVDFFGGEEAFKHRIWLDNKKRRKCSENNVKLIEWNYQESISLTNLRKKLSEV